MNSNEVGSTVGGHSLLPLVWIGLTDMPKYGGPLPPSSVGPDMYDAAH